MSTQIFIERKRRSWKRWAVYLLVWNLPDGTVKVYVGGSTNVVNRWGSYRKLFVFGRPPAKFAGVVAAVGLPTFVELERVPPGSCTFLAARETAWTQAAIAALGRGAVLNHRDTAEPQDYGGFAWMDECLAVQSGAGDADAADPRHSSPSALMLDRISAEAAGSSRKSDPT